MTQDDEQAIATGLAVALDVAKRIKRNHPQDLEWAMPFLQEVSIELAGTWMVYDATIEALKIADEEVGDATVQ